MTIDVLGEHLAGLEEIRRQTGDRTRSSPAPRIRLHDLRHTHASLLLAAGVNPKVVSERLGHSSVAFTLDTYAHVMPGMQPDAAELFIRLVFNGDGDHPDTEEETDDVPTATPERPTDETCDRVVTAQRETLSRKSGTAR